MNIILSCFKVLKMWNLCGKFIANIIACFYLRSNKCFMILEEESTVYDYAQIILFFLHCYVSNINKRCKMS